MIDRAGADDEPYRPSYHYLMGDIELEEKEYARALAELEQADQSDVFIQWLQARARGGLGDEAGANAIVEKTRAQKGGGFRYALVRRELLARDAKVARGSAP